MFWKNILSLDEKLTASLRIHEHQKWMRPIGVFFAHSGDSWFILLLLMLVWFFTRGYWHRLSALLAGSVVMLAILVLAIKFLIKRRRPEGTWGAIYRNSDPHSFPSGHAARTMMLARSDSAAWPNMAGNRAGFLVIDGQPGAGRHECALYF